MAQLGISAAARAVGKDRGTIHRYIKSGKLSVSKDAAENSVIETSELLRVVGSLKGDGSKGGVAATVAPPVENSNAQHVLEATLELLKEQLKVSQERETRLLAMLEHEQESRRELERRLLPPGSDQAQEAEPGDTSAQKPNAALEVEVIPAASVSVVVPPQGETGEEKKGFFARLFGK
jgi:hypothetical protein